MSRPVSAAQSRMHGVEADVETAKVSGLLSDAAATADSFLRFSLPEVLFIGHAEVIQQSTAAGLWWDIGISHAATL